MYQKRTLERKVASLWSSMYSRGVRPMPSREWIRNKILATPDCVYCGKPIKMKEYSADHKIPLARGGSNTPNNIQFVNIGCNKSKGNMTDDEFRALIVFMAPFPEMSKDVMTRLRAGGGFIYNGWHSKVNK